MSIDNDRIWQRITTSAIGNSSCPDCGEDAEVYALQNYLSHGDIVRCSWCNAHGLLDRNDVAQPLGYVQWT